VTTIARATPNAGLAGPVTQVGPVLAAILLALRGSINRLNRWLMIPAQRAGMGPWIANPLSGYILLLRARGRRTGLLREAPLSYRIADGAIWVLAGFGPATHWFQNVLAQPEVEVLLPGRVVRCRAEAVADPLVRRRIAPALVRATGLPGALIGCNPWTAPDDRILDQLAGVPLVCLRPVDGPIAAGPDDPGGRAWLWRQSLLALAAVTVVRALRPRRAAAQPAG
jgi:deazaflavin-dependent oxidoreductase (nitroreductase family)